MEFCKSRFDSIQALRGIAALFVIMEHIRFLNCGAFGVDIFFCISGFMLMLSTERSSEHFFSKRLIRILPLYYLMTVFTFLLLLIAPGLFDQTEANISYLMKSLLFLPFEISEGVLQPLVRVGWTVNCEMFFYLLFWIAMKLSFRLRGLLCSLFLVIMVGVTAVLSIEAPFFAFYGNAVMLDFILGILLYYICRKIWENRNEPIHRSLLTAIWTLLISCCFILMIYTRNHYDMTGFLRPLLWGVPAMVIVLGFFVLGLYYRFSGALVNLGNISFSLYLLHYYPITFLDRRIFSMDVLSVSSVIGLVTGIACSVILAIISYFVVEVFLTRILKKALHIAG